MLLIRYNELGLKSPRVRGRFQKRMIQNIEEKFLRTGLDCIIDSDWGRIYLHTDEQAKGINILTTVFGIKSVSPVIQTSAELNEVADRAVAYAKSLLKHGQSFALRTRRTGKHEYTSMELAQHIGSAILEQLKDLKLTVNLKRPEVEIFIEVRRKDAFIFSESYSGPGGLPFGTQGKILSIFTDKYSYIATWLMMKRGCRTYPVYMKANNHDSTQFENDVNSQLEILKGWVPNIKLKTIEISHNTKDSSSPENDPAIPALDNRDLLTYAAYVHAKGICISSSIEDFPLIAQNLNISLPVFYPLIGLDENKIKEIGAMIKKKKF